MPRTEPGGCVEIRFVDLARFVSHNTFAIYSGSASAYCAASTSSIAAILFAIADRSRIHTTIVVNRPTSDRPYQFSVVAARESGRTQVRLDADNQSRITDDSATMPLSDGI